MGAYEIIFVNEAWDSVEVQLATGSSQDCGLNPSLGTKTLNRGSEWSISTDDIVVCFRRTANPDDPASGWGGWNSFAPDESNTPARIPL